MNTTALPTTGINVTRVPEGWVIESATDLTDAQASTITFRADPQDVTLADFVRVTDPEGDRIGEVSAAVLSRDTFGPAYATVAINLR